VPCSAPWAARWFPDVKIISADLRAVSIATGASNDRSQGAHRNDLHLHHRYHGTTTLAVFSRSRMRYDLFAPGLQSSQHLAAGCGERCSTASTRTAAPSRTSNGSSCVDSDMRQPVSNPAAASAPPAPAAHPRFKSRRKRLAGGRTIIGQSESGSPQIEMFEKPLPGFTRAQSSTTVADRMLKNPQRPD